MLDQPIKEGPETTAVEVTKQVPGKLVFSINAPTPKWATIVFRVTICLCTFASSVVAGDDGIDNVTKVKVMLYLTQGTTLIWGLGRIIGIKKEEIEKDL